MNRTHDESVGNGILNHRRFLNTALCACAISPRLGLSHMQLAASLSESLTKEQRDGMTPSQVIDELKKGNERFRSGKMVPTDYLAQKRSSAAGQYPAAVVLGCLDSRVPAEIVFDAGIGDIFVGRVAGNIVNDDMLGSMEFACAVSGAKLVLVLGHSACGAVKGAIDDVVLGNLTGLLARIKPAISATKFEGKHQNCRSDVRSDKWSGAVCQLIATMFRHLPHRKMKRIDHAPPAPSRSRTSSPWLP